MANIPHQPAKELTPMSSPWPFAQWRIHIIGPLPTGTSQKKFTIIAVNYFTKWVEAEAVAKITTKKTTNFIKKLIIYRFGIPETIVTYHGTQFDNAIFRALCEEHSINLRFTSPAHPQTNGQAIRTMSHSVTSETPFELPFGTEVVLPTELYVKTRRVHSYSPSDNDSELRASLDELEEQRDNARLKVAALQQRTSKYYDSNVKIRRFGIEDLTLKKVIPNVIGHGWSVSEKTILRDMNGSE
ncbi:hypothetical protein ACOSQ4_005380 [Xanthoceras sorbifolium]